MMLAITTPTNASSDNTTVGQALESPLRPVCESLRAPCGVGSNGSVSSVAVTTTASPLLSGERVAEVSNVSWSPLVGPYTQSLSTVFVFDDFVEPDAAGE